MVVIEGDGFTIGESRARGLTAAPSVVIGKFTTKFLPNLGWEWKKQRAR